MNPPLPKYYARALIQKTSDGGKTFENVFNVTTPNGRSVDTGVGVMGGIGCASEDVCYALSSCEEPDICMPKNQTKVRGYGSYLHKTTDGGKTWSTMAFEYEKVFNVIQVLSHDEFWIGGSEVGMLGGGKVWSSTDGGKTLTLHEFKGKGAGEVVGLSMAPDGKTGFATTISAFRASASNSASAVWHFQA